MLAGTMTVLETEAPGGAATDASGTGGRAVEVEDGATTGSSVHAANRIVAADARDARRARERIVIVTPLAGVLRRRAPAGGAASVAATSALGSSSTTSAETRF